MNFAELGLRRELVRAVTDAGYNTPTSVQKRGIPVALEGRDLIACAQTGTGKTAAFLLPILQHLAGGQASRHPRALVVAPTRELAAQIGEMATQYGRHLHLRSTVIFGGVRMEPQTRRLARGLDLLIATPGRLLDHIRRSQVNLGAVTMVVLDEADRMLDMGFLPDVRRILAALPAERQNLFLSATMPEEIERLIRRTAHAPVVIEVARRATPVGAIRQVVHPVAQTHKKELLKTLLGRGDMGPTLVFTRTKARANQLIKRLEHSGRRIGVIHGNKSQNARARAIAGLRTGQIDTLIATDIAARGLDVDSISHVVNFDLPHVPEDYVHRIGRTARAGQDGDAISLVAPEERSQLAAIERLVGNSIRREDVAGFMPPVSAVTNRPPERPKAGPAGRASRPGSGSTRPAAARSGRGHSAPSRSLRRARSRGRRDAAAPGRAN
ncbi:MAG: DEAD/DEAH box helicase [Acidobacteriia bacterium]|nr:DEAD/DEAH box helicase [Terriglobia bacterium]MYG04497.1 DEAD/DEAH box helicase [Terriglobia bacterium]MYK11940.1 DEAD/DEAH box helicase [Terriglobia bacterium]